MNNVPTLPPLDTKTASGLVHYKEILLDLPYAPTVSRIVDLIDALLEAVVEVRRG